MCSWTNVVRLWCLFCLALKTLNTKDRNPQTRVILVMLTNDVACPCFLLIYPNDHASCLYGGPFDGLAICGLSAETFHHMTHLHDESTIKYLGSSV